MFYLSIKIFFARILDVTLGVIRTVEIVKKNTIKAVIIAFFEVLIWYIVAREALTYKEFNIVIAVCYSLGYAFGTLIGSFISNYFIGGNSGIFIVSKVINKKEINIIKNNGYRLSSLTLDNDNKMLFIEVDNRKVKGLLSLIKSIDKQSFVCIIDAKKNFFNFL
jgi:uncharacterized protein YebE (UPF0316 family)